MLGRVKSYVKKSYLLQFILVKGEMTYDFLCVSRNQVLFFVKKSDKSEGDESSNEQHNLGNQVDMLVLD